MGNGIESGRVIDLFFKLEGYPELTVAKSKLMLQLRVFTTCGSSVVERCCMAKVVGSNPTPGIS